MFSAHLLGGRRCRGRLKRWHHWLDPSGSSVHKPVWISCWFCPAEHKHLQKTLSAQSQKMWRGCVTNQLELLFPMFRLTTMFLGRLMRSAMVLISLKAFSMARSELLIVRRFWYFELPNSSKLAAPVPWRKTFSSEIYLMKPWLFTKFDPTSCSTELRTSKAKNKTVTTSHRSQSWLLVHRLTLLIMVVRSPPLSSGFWASPTLDGSLRAFSLENVLHSEPTSITRSPEERRVELLNSNNNIASGGSQNNKSVIWWGTALIIKLTEKNNQMLYE